MKMALRAVGFLGVATLAWACGGPEGDPDGSSAPDAARDGGTFTDGGGIPDPPPPYGPPPGTPVDTPTGIYYDIVYVRAPRAGDDQNTSIPEVLDPIDAEPGTDLMLRHPDGTEEVLVPGGPGAVWDPYVSFDGRSVYYAHFHDLTDFNTQRRDASRAGADIFRIDLDSREITQLTFQEWTPNAAAGNWSRDHLASESGENSLRYGIFNLGPCPLPGGRLMFTSSRNGFLPNKSFTFPNLQLYVMDEDGRNVELIGHLNLGSALHPTILADGRVMFSSYEAQALRDQRVWGVWAIWPDGRAWEPLMSAFDSPQAFHFQAQRSDGRIVVTEYYNLNNNGFGNFLDFPAWRPDDAPPFGSIDPSDPSNPLLEAGWFGDGDRRSYRMSLSPWGLRAITPFAHPRDDPSSIDPGTGEPAGKVSHPTGAPHNELLLAYTTGPANHRNMLYLPAYDAGIYLAHDSYPIGTAAELVEVVNLPEYNEMFPRAVVPYRDIYGIAEPFELTYVPNDGSRHSALPEGTPFGLVGTSSFVNRDTAPGTGSDAFDGLDPFNTSQNDPSSNWFAQGSDVGLYEDDDIYAVRVLAMEPTSHRSYGPAENSNRASFFNHANERLRVLGEVVVRNTDASGEPEIDPTGAPDTSFLARIPADVPFTFQTLDRRGMVLNFSQTWHQVRPGEVRTDCGGCHAHAHMGVPFAGTAASRPGYALADLTDQTPLLTLDEAGEPTVRTEAARAVDVEYYRDIRPLLDRSCVPCHNATQTDGELNLDDRAMIDGYEGTYHRLANDADAQWGIAPVITNGTWRQTNASRYIRMFQARRSLLIWKIFGERLDGWTNDDHPTESTPGDVSTLPAGANPNDADLDYIGTIMPPDGSSVPPLTHDERMLFVRWIDLGCPITRQDDHAPYSWFLDDLRPTLTVSTPRPGANPAIDVLRVGAFDYYAGLDESSLVVTADFEVDGAAPGTDLAASFTRDANGIWSLPLATPIDALPDGTLTVRVRDHAGNVTELRRTFSVGGP